MKILEINVFNYRKGGSEAVYFNTIELLQEHGNNVINFALKWKENKSSPQEKYFPESKDTRQGMMRSVSNIICYFYHREAAQKLEELIIKEKPDIAQIHLLWGQITGSILPVLKRHNIPIVFTIHEYRIVCPAYTFRNGKGQICEKCQGKHFYMCIVNKCCKNNYGLSTMMAFEQYFRNHYFNPEKYIDGFVYVSQFAKNKLTQYIPKLKEKPNVVLYNFIHRFKYLDDILPKRDKYFLFFGRLSHEKGIKTLIKAFKETPDCILKIAGTGPLEEELKTYVLQNEIKNIEFLGYQSGNKLQVLVENAYFIMTPSEWYENNPMTIIEGYAAAVPVIGANIGGIPEIIDNGKTGYLFENGNIKELIYLINKSKSLSDKAYIELCINALTFAKQNFNKNTYYIELMKFFKNLIDLYKAKSSI